MTTYLDTNLDTSAASQYLIPSQQMDRDDCGELIYQTTSGTTTPSVLLTEATTFWYGTNQYYDWGSNQPMPANPGDMFPPAE